MQKTKCAIAGQDQNSFGFDEEDNRCIELKLALHEQIHLLYKNGTRVFHTDCSPGVSMWSAEIVTKLMSLHSDLELICVAPYEGHAINWPKVYRDRYDSLHNNCTQRILLSTDYTITRLLECYRYLIDACDIFLAVCDNNNPGLDKIGFMESYAKNIGRHVIYINPFTLAVTPAASESYR